MYNISKYLAIIKSTGVRLYPVFIVLYSKKYYIRILGLIRIHSLNIMLDIISHPLCYLIVRLKYFIDISIFYATVLTKVT